MRISVTAASAMAASSSETVPTVLVVALARAQRRRSAAQTISMRDAPRRWQRRPRLFTRASLQYVHVFHYVVPFHSHNYVVKENCESDRIGLRATGHTGLRTYRLYTESRRTAGRPSQSPSSRRGAYAPTSPGIAACGAPLVLGARCGESRSPVLSPGSKEPRRETGPAAMGHPPWGSSMGFT